MKNIFLFLLSIFALASCSNDDSNGNNINLSQEPEADANLLSLVVFHEGSANENRWEFNENGFPISCVAKNYYLGNLESQAQFINYHYQGTIQSRGQNL